MQKAIEGAVALFLNKIQGKSIKIISHYDTDGIISASIMAKTLKRLDRKFTIKIIKQLDKEQIEQIKKSAKKEILLFLDLGSSSLEELNKLESDIFIIDHHEISGESGKNIVFINPRMYGMEELSAAGITYLFSKNINQENKELADLSVIGMVGDMLDREISKLNNTIIQDAKVVIKKGLMLYPATRPVHKTLEFSSSFFIPGVTGNSKGVLNLLGEAGIKRENNEYKSLIELNEGELSKLLTAILLRTKCSGAELIGNIYLINFFNRLEDARELSAMINACSRLGNSEIALSLCLGNGKARKRAEEIYAEYKQHLVSALNFVEQNKIEGKGYVLINAKDRIKDTMIGTIASIISMSREYEDGTIIIAMSYDQDKIKISARVAGRNGINVREMLKIVSQPVGGECGGHPRAAGCLISKEKEKEFLENLTKNLEMPIIKI